MKGEEGKMEGYRKSIRKERRKGNYRDLRRMIK